LVIDEMPMVVGQKCWNPGEMLAADGQCWCDGR
jgi:hypothetical protein